MESQNQMCSVLETVSEPLPAIQEIVQVLFNDEEKFNLFFIDSFVSYFKVGLDGWIKGNVQHHVEVVSKSKREHVNLMESPNQMLIVVETVSEQ